MEKVKKILLITVAAILTLIILLFLVQFIDAQVNRKTYAAVDKALTDYRKTISQNQQLCLRNYYDILNNTQFKVLKDPKVVLPAEYKSSKIYDTTLNYCNGLANDIDKVDIPKDIPEEKSVLFDDLVQYGKESASLYIDKLESLKACKGNNTCITKQETLLGKDPFKSALVSYNTTLTELQLTKKMDVNYIFVGFFKELTLKNQISSLEKSKAAYDEMETRKNAAIEQAKKQPKINPKAVPAATPKK